MWKNGKTPDVTTDAAHVTPRAFELPSALCTYRMTAGTVSRKTQVIDATRNRTVIITAENDVWAVAGASPTAVAPAAGAAADQTGTGAGGVLLLGGNQVPFCVFAGHAIAFITEAGASGITYTVLP